MKIIGETQDGRIVEMTNTELARLIGYHSEHSCCIPPVGAEVKINEMYDQLRAVANFDYEVGKIRSAANNLLATLEVGDPVVRPTIEAVKKGMH